MLRSHVLDPQLLGTEKAITVPAEMMVRALYMALSHAETLKSRGRSHHRAGGSWKASAKRSAYYKVANSL